MQSRTRTWTMLALVGLAGCATARPAPAAMAQKFTGRPYDIKDEGNRITGSVCGVNVDYTVALGRDGTQLNGFIGRRAAYFEIKPTATGRRVVGTTGRTGVGEVDLLVDDDSIKGRAGIRSFDLKANGDFFAGPMTALGTIGSVAAVVGGRGELSHMPTADVGAILPALLNCSAPMAHSTVRDGMVVGFGGAAGYETSAANELR